MPGENRVMTETITPPSTSELTPLQRRIVRDIVSLMRHENLKAGDRLAESTLAKKIGTSRTPVNIALRHLAEQPVGPQGMKIDRMFFESFEATAKADADLQTFVDNEQWDQAVDHVAHHLLDKPAEFYTLDKLRRAAGVDRRLTLREILEKIFGLIPGFKSKDELLDAEFQKFLLDQPPETLSKHADAIVALQYFFKAYATDSRLRDTIEQRRFTDLNVNPAFTMADFKAVPKEWRERLPEYIKDYVALNLFM